MSAGVSKSALIPFRSRLNGAPIRAASLARTLAYPYIVSSPSSRKSVSLSSAPELADPRAVSGQQAASVSSLDRPIIFLVDCYITT